MKCLNLVLLLSIFPVVCSSQVKKGDINFGFSIGIINDDVSEYSTTSYSISADIGYSMTEHLNCGIYFGLQKGWFNNYINDTYTGNPLDQEKITVKPFVKYYFIPENKNRVFIQVNGVYNHMTEKENKRIIIVYPVVKGNKDEIGLTVSPGIELSLGSKFSMVGSLAAAYYLRNFQRPSSKSFGIGSGGSLGIQKTF